MFDTERFIIEVQNRLCLWNVKVKSYSDRRAKRRAWEEIAQILFVEWDKYTLVKRNETLSELQKKWKHLRDYYVREKKKESDVNSGNAVARKRHTPYLDMLHFLDTAREMRPKTTSSNPVNKEETSDEEIPQRESAIENESSRSSNHSDSKSESRKSQNMTRFQRSLINSMEKSSKDESDSDKMFLLSLLPQMKKMNEAQNFDFRLDVMNLVKKYRFDATAQMQQYATEFVQVDYE